MTQPAATHLDNTQKISFTDGSVQQSAVSMGAPVTVTTPAQGDVLTYNTIAAQWTNQPAAAPAGGTTQTVSSVPISTLTGSVTGPTALLFPTPFADNNYTLYVTAVAAEPPLTPTLTQSPSVGIFSVVLLPAGVGVNVWVVNNDSGTHMVTIHVTATHS
jgi:hypothetical protein